MKQISWLTVLFGWMIAAAFAFGGEYLVLSLGASGQGFNSWRIYGGALAAQPIGVLVGSFIAARMSRKLFIGHGGLVGGFILIGEIISWLLEGYVLPPVVIPIWLSLPVSGAIGGWLALRLPGNKPLTETENPTPRWFTGAMKGMAIFLLITGLMLSTSLRNEGGFIYINGLTGLGYITEAVLLPGFLVSRLIFTGNYQISQISNYTFQLVVSGIPWAVFGGLLAEGHKKWAVIFVVSVVLVIAIPAILILLYAIGMAE